MADIAANYVLSEPWAIDADRLQEIYAIACRENESIEAVEKRLGRPLDNSETTVVREGGVAVVPVVGAIMRRGNMFTKVSGASSYETIAKDFQAALDDPSVRSIVLKIDSPGGTANGCSSMADLIYQSRGRKPIVAVACDMATSAAYYIASAADSVVASPSAMLGSIGVILQAERTKDDKNSITFVSSVSPDKKSDTETPEGRSKIQGMIDDLGAVFVADVAKHRGVSAETVLSDFGQGGIVIGQKAVEAGLADRVGTLESVIAALAMGKSPLATPSLESAASSPHVSKGQPSMSQPSENVAADFNAAEFARLQEQFAKQEAALKAALERADAVEVDSLVKAAVAGGQFKPEATANLTVAFKTALSDDREDGGNRVETLKSVFANIRPATVLNAGVGRELKTGETVLTNPIQDKPAASGISVDAFFAMIKRDAPKQFDKLHAEYVADPAVFKKSKNLS